MSTTLPPRQTTPPAPKTKTPVAQPATKPASSEAAPAVDRIPTPREMKLPYGINWVNVGWLSLLHVGALAAPWTFTWSGLAVMLFFHWVCGSIGICLGFHRFLTHGGFKTSAPVKWALATIGGFAGEGAALDWVATHREHHAHSDLDGDPHSPHDGSWWSHMWWLARRKTPAQQRAHIKRWAPDLLKDKSLVYISWAFLPSHFILGSIMFGIGYAIGGMPVAISWVVWGVFVRLVAVLHTTWLVNSWSHMFGYRNYETTDDSRNNWFVALIAYGEGWHNNHHAHPRMAVHGHRWWEFDATWQAIRLLRACGLIWDVVEYRSHKEKDPGAGVDQAA